MPDKVPNYNGVVAVLVGLLTALGTTLTILSRYVSADTFNTYKEQNLVIAQIYENRSERLETKMDALLTKNGIVIVQKEIKGD